MSSPTILTEFDLYFPVFYNDGKPVSRATLRKFKKQLVKEFGGLTDFRHRGEGTWRVGGVTFRDEIVILRVLAKSRTKGRLFLRKIKRDIGEELHQEEVLIVERSVRRL